MRPSSHDFQVFLERLKGTDMSGDSDRDSSVEEFSSRDGKSKGHVVFKRSLDEVTTPTSIEFDSMVSLFFFPGGGVVLNLKLFRKFKVTFRKIGYILLIKNTIMGRLFKQSLDNVCERHRLTHV